MRTFSAALFDMDGVVIDTRGYIVRWWRDFAATKGVTLTDDHIDAHIHGVPVVDSLRRLFPMMPPEKDADLLAQIAEDERHQTYTEVPGVVAFLRALKASGMPTALVTSGMPWKVAAVVQQLSLDGLFGAVVTAADIERGKPDPSCYLAAARKLGVAPSECVVFEDALSGVQAAVAAGMTCVGVDEAGTGTPLVAAGAVHRIADFRGATVGAGGIGLPGDF